MGDRRERVAATGRVDMFRALRHRNFRLFFAGQFVSQVGNWLLLIGQSLLVLRLTDDSGIALGALVACQYLPVLAFVAWAGLVADRRPKRELLIWVNSLGMTQSFAFALLALLDRPPLPAVFALASLGGVATAFDNPTRRAFVAELVPEDDLINAMGLNSSMLTGARVVGPALAGLLVSTVGFSWCFALDGLTYLAVIVGLRRMDGSALRPPNISPRAGGQIRAGLRYARSVDELRIPLVMLSVIGMFAFNFTVVLPLFVKQTFGAGETAFTLLYAVLSLGSVGGALITARRRSVTLRSVAAAAAVFGVGLGAMAAAPSLGLAYPAALVVGLVSVVFMTSTTSIVQLRADPSMRGRVLSLQSLAVLGSTPIGGPVVGAACERWGARSGWLIGAAACAVAAVYGFSASLRLPAPSRIDSGPPDD